MNDDGIDALPASRAELGARLTAAGIAPALVALLLDRSRPALALGTEPAAEDGIPIGATKLGGRPDLPAGMAWPHRPAYPGAAAMAEEYARDAARLRAEADAGSSWLSAEDAAFATREMLAKAEAVASTFPLSFIGQFDLAALARQPGFDPALPRRGRLYLFHDLFILPAGFDPGSAVGFRLFHDAAPAAGLVRAPVPERLLALAAFQGGVLQPAVVTARPVVTTMPTGDAAWRALGPVADEDAGTYHDWLFTLGAPDDERGGNHQLGGWPRAIQGGMQRMSQLAANGIHAGAADAYRSVAAEGLLRDAAAWRLVLQFGRDDGIGHGLPGALQVLLREEDLAAGRFDRAWVVYEQS
jgi:hypothetical protein